MHAKQSITYFYIVLFSLFQNILVAQSEEDLVRATIAKYIEGTSYNKSDILRDAFYEDALLFLSHKEKPIFIMTISEYAALFEKREKGKFNGRMGKILSVSVENDIAQAKAAIFIEGNPQSYIDIFLLKKLNGHWKIISKAATTKK